MPTSSTNLSKTLFPTPLPPPTCRPTTPILLLSSARHRPNTKTRLLRCTSKLESSKNGGGSGKTLLEGKSKKVVRLGTAPPLSEGNSGEDKSGGFPLWVSVKKIPKKLLAVLSNLPLAIGEMFAIAALMALGTLIDQGEAPDYYFQKYPDENSVLGLFTWRWILALGFDHMFSSPVFLGLLVLLAASLMACTYTTQIPLVRVAKRWSFMQSADAILKQEFSDTLPRASIQDLGVILMGSGYEVFMKGPSLYAFKGLAGRFAPIGVHLAMLLIMAGATLSASGSFKGSITVPQGLNFVVGDVMSPTGFLSTPTDTFNTEIHVNKFYMDYYESGEVSQFHSDVSLYDTNGNEVIRKTISVNDPLRYGGFTIYQTDWGISALQVTKNGEGPFNLPVARLQTNGDKKLYGTFLPVGDPDAPDVKGISMLARDLQSVVLYDLDGKFAGVRRPSSKLPIEIDGNTIVVEDAIGSTGLDLKTDPGVPVVYMGFGALMLTTCLSYLSHSQIWALQDGTVIVVGGKTNRAKLEFPDEMNRLLNSVPELVIVNNSEEHNISEQHTPIPGEP